MDMRCMGRCMTPWGRWKRKIWREDKKVKSELRREAKELEAQRRSALLLVHADSNHKAATSDAPAYTEAISEQRRRTSLASTA